MVDTGRTWYFLKRREKIQAREECGRRNFAIARVFAPFTSIILEKRAFLELTTIRHFFVYILQWDFPS